MPNTNPFDKEKLIETFTKDIDYLCDQIGSQTDAAAVLGISQNMVSVYRRGKNLEVPPLELIGRVMVLLRFESLDAYIEHLQKGSGRAVRKAAEEGGLLGAQAIARSLSKDQLVKLMETVSQELAKK